MFERYTESARRALFFARYEASLIGGAAIETEHLLLGVARENKGISAAIFSRADVTAEELNREVRRRVVSGGRVSTSAELPFSEETKRALQFAAEEADRLRHGYIGTEHLLLGLTRETGCVAASILAERQIDEASVRETIRRLLAEPPRRSEEAETPAVLIERIKELVEHLGRMQVSPSEQTLAADRIVHELNKLRRLLES